MDMFYIAALVVIIFLTIVGSLVFYIFIPKYGKKIKLDQEYLNNSGPSFEYALSFIEIVNNLEDIENGSQQRKLQ